MSNQETGENSRSVSDSAMQLPHSEVIFVRQDSATKPRYISAKKRFLNILHAHFENDPEKPLDYVKVRRILGISSPGLTKIKNSLRDAGVPLPTSTIEHAQWLRRQAGIPKRPSSAILQANKEERRARREAARLERENLIQEVKRLRYKGLGPTQIVGQINSPVSLRSVSHIVAGLIKKEEITRLKKEPRANEEISVFDEKVRNLYNLRYTYREISEWLDNESLSNINNALERLEVSGEILRRHPREKKK